MALIKIFSKGFISNVKSALRKVEGELNDHLDCINANSNEIQSIYELLTEVDGKLDKLNSRIDALQIRIEGEVTIPEYEIEELTRREKEVFTALYTSDNITYKELARTLGFEEVMVQEYITNLIAKGVPVIKKFQNNIITISLDPNFKEQQLKKQIIKV